MLEPSLLGSDNGGEGWLFDVGFFYTPERRSSLFFFFFETLNFLEGEVAVYIYHTPFILSVTWCPIKGVFAILAIVQEQASNVIVPRCKPNENTSKSIRCPVWLLWLESAFKRQPTSSS